MTSILYLLEIALLPCVLSVFIMMSAGFESLVSKSTHVRYAYGEQEALCTQMITNVSFSTSISREKYHFFPGNLKSSVV